MQESDSDRILFLRSYWLALKMMGGHRVRNARRVILAEEEGRALKKKLTHAPNGHSMGPVTEVD